MIFFDREEGVKVCFEADKSMCCSIENSQTLVHGRGGRGYGVADVGFSSGINPCNKTFVALLS